MDFTHWSEEGLLPLTGPSSFQRGLEVDRVRDLDWQRGGSPSVTTGVDSDSGKPCLPRQNLTVALALFHELEKHFLGNLFGFMSVDQEQAAQLENPCVMRATEFFATGGCSQ